MPGPAGSERGPRSPTLRQRRRGSASRAPQGPNGEKRGRDAPDPDPTPPPARKSKKPRGERGVSAETMKLGGAQTRRRACFLTTCQQRGEARLPTTAPRVLCLRRKQQLPFQTQPQQRERPPLGPASPGAEKSTKSLSPRTQRRPSSTFPWDSRPRRAQPASLTFLAFHSGAPLPARGDAGVSRG